MSLSRTELDTGCLVTEILFENPTLIAIPEEDENAYTNPIGGIFILL